MSAISSSVAPAAPSPSDIAKRASAAESVSAPATSVRRRAGAGGAEVSQRPAGAGGAQTMLKLSTGDGEGGLKVDPFVVVVLSLAFIASIFFLHISSKLIRMVTK